MYMCVIAFIVQGFPQEFDMLLKALYYLVHGHGQVHQKEFFIFSDAYIYVLCCVENLS